MVGQVTGEGCTDQTLRLGVWKAGWTVRIPDSVANQIRSSSPSIPPAPINIPPKNRLWSGALRWATSFTRQHRRPRKTRPASLRLPLARPSQQQQPYVRINPRVGLSSVVLLLSPRASLPTNTATMSRVYAEVNQNMPRSYWDYDSVNISQ